MANMTFKASLLPSTDNTYSLGSNNTNIKRWKINGFAGNPIEYIVGTQTAATGSWTGVTQDSELITGKVIAYKLPYAGSGNASLTLTFTNPTGGATSGAIPVYLNNTRATTHYAANSVIIMVYDGTNWRSTDYWNSNSRDAGYGSIALTQSSAVTAITTNTTAPTAKTYNEKLTLTAGNKWVQFAGTNSSTAGADVLTVGHSLSGVTAGDYGDASNQTPNYGDTFNVPTLSVDAAGHITTISTHTVKIPASDNTDVKQRTYGSTTNVELPIAGINDSASTTATVPSIGTSYKDVYAAIPTSNIATINPSTGKITIPGGLKVGVGNSTRMPTTGIEVQDTRTEDFAPATIGKGINFFFTDRVSPYGSTWCAGMYVRGWWSGTNNVGTNNYAAWCLTGPAANTDVSTQPLYVRTSKSTTVWGAYRKIYDTSNKPTPSEILGDSNTTKFWRGDNSWSDELTDNLKVKTLTITDTNASEHLKFSRNGYNYITIPNEATASLAFGRGANSTSTLIRLTPTTLQPERTNEISLGESGIRWSKLYVGTADSYGSNTQPIYWNAGVPTAITYTANRLYYPSTTTAFTAGTHFVSDTKIAINSTSTPNETLYVNGTSYHNGNDTHAGNIEPSVDSTYNIGSTSLHWQHGYYDDLYISTNTTYTANNSAVAGTSISTGQIDLTGNPPKIQLHRGNGAAVTGTISSETAYGIQLNGTASATGAAVYITGTAGTTGITYNSRTIKPILSVSGPIHSTNSIESSSYFLSNATGTSNLNHGYYLYYDAAQYGRLYVNKKGTATTGDGGGTPYTNTTGEAILSLGNDKQGTPGASNSVVNNACGRLIIYGQGTKYSEIRSSLTGTTGPYTHDLPALSGYLQTNSPNVAITKTDGEWTAANWSAYSGFYLPLVQATGRAFLSDVFQPQVRLYKAASSKGYSFLCLGNGVAQGTAKNCYGSLILYGTGAYYSKLSTAQVTANNTVYLPAYNGTAYLAHTADNNAVGSPTKPVYVAANGRITETNIDFDNLTFDDYVKKSGDTMTGVLTINNATVSSNKTTGALIVTGGIGCSNNIYGDKVYGAVWNDYAEYRKDNQKEKEIQCPGRCIKENGDGSLSLTTKRLERGCEIISDTFGFGIGQDEENGYNTPIASSGRVLAYPFESIKEFASHIGYAVCSGPNGTVSIMTDEEEEKYPSRIIGTISEIPNYEEWGTGKVKVNDRIWIRIR